MGVIYRNLQKTDASAIKSILNESFRLYSYVDNRGVLESYLNSYLQSCLAEATFACVAEKEGVPVGVIMGKADRDYRLLPHLKPLLAQGYHTLAMKGKALLTQCKNRDYKPMHQAYRELSAACPRKFDGVLTVFAITEACRGLGVGKELLRRLVAYQKAHGVTNSYLYTDTSCNVGFYEHQGFERLEEKELHVTQEGAKKKMGVYLYGYTIGA